MAQLIERIHSKAIQEENCDSELNDQQETMNKAQLDSGKISKFRQDFNDGESIEESKNFVLKHLDELWKK